MSTQPRDCQAGGQPPADGPHWIAERTFRRGDVAQVRRFAESFGPRVGLRGAQLIDFVLAVTEAAACVIAHWPGAARARLWSAGARVYCEVRGDALVRRDNGRDAACGRPSGGPYGEEDALRRHVLRRVCDYYCVATGTDGTRVLLTMAVRRAARDPSGRAGMRRPR
jgi:hypothetical protein